jgi:hypothetical protein
MIPGQTFKGYSIQIPSRYEGMTSREMTLQMLKEHNNEEWFETRGRGRRKGEEPKVVVTRYALQEDTAVQAEMSPAAHQQIDTEALKNKLRELAAAKENQ